MKPFKVRDFRNKNFFLMDDAYLNGYAKFLDPSTTVVYLSLCRHVDKEQSAFPSETLIAEEHNIDKRTVIRKIKKLKEWNLIRVERTRNKEGKWLRNTYFLLDKSEWKNPEEMKKIASINHPGDTESLGHPGDKSNIIQVTNDAKTQVTQSHTKDTHIYKETHIKDTQRELIKKIINWAFNDARIKPGVSEKIYRILIENGISLYGEQKIYDLFKNEDNAITLLTNIKYLKK